MTTTTPDFTKLSSSELAQILRDLPVNEWNQAVEIARGERPGYGADLHGADLHGADLHGANLRWADLHGADLREADLHGANLREANLREANLHGANLREADLHGANLREADLREADLRWADLHGANLHGADLHGADGNRVTLTGERYHAGILGGYELWVFATTEAPHHVIKCGCWTGTVDGVEARAVEEWGEDSLYTAQARLLVPVIEATLNGWGSASIILSG